MNQGVKSRWDRIWAFFLSMLAKEEVSFEEEHRRMLCGLFVLLGVILMIMFGTFHLLNGQFLEGVMNFASAFIGVGAVLFLRTRRSGVNIYRIVVITLAVLFIYFGTVVPNDFRILWLYSFPLFAFFLLGPLEGILITAIVLAGWLVFLQLPASMTGAAFYGPAFKVRFLATFCLVLIWTIFFEFVRGKYQKGMEKKQNDLEHKTNELSRANVALQSAGEAAEEGRQKAESANRAKSVFLANMSHELRTPLNAILGFSELLSQSAALSSDHREEVDIINRSGKHLLTLIDQVLDLSKIEAGRMDVEAADFDLSGMISDLKDMFAIRAEERSLQFILEWADDMPRYIRTDEVKLRQVFINLLSNAIKFTREGGITFRAGLSHEASGTQRQESGNGAPDSLSTIPLRFEIEDSGPGISPEEMGTLFEPFTQTTSGRQSREGTGLGLPISRRFVQVMGGDIRVKSKVGHGSIFSFHIHAEIVEQESVVERETQLSKRVTALASGEPRYRILVVDDVADNRTVLLRILRPLGFDVREAENGAEAIETWKEFKPQFIWMDMRMPVMDGYEATRRIKATAGDESPVIVALTASAFEEKEKEVLEAGCDAFLRKPFIEQDIFEKMGEHLGVRYVYEGISDREPSTAAEEPLSPEDLKKSMSALPRTLSTRLKEAIDLGAIESIEQAIDEVRSEDAALADALAKMAGEFTYDEILALVLEEEE